jgi:hypothetical protein
MYPPLIYPKIFKNPKDKNFTLPLLIHPCHEVVWRSGDMVPRFRSWALDRSYLSLSVVAALPLGKGSQCRLHRRRSAPQSLSGLWRTQMLFYLPGNRIRIPPPYITWSNHYTNWSSSSSFENFKVIYFPASPPRDVQFSVAASATTSWQERRVYALSPWKRAVTTRQVADAVCRQSSA